MCVGLANTIGLQNSSNIMFGLFKSKKWVKQVETELLSKVFQMLPGDYEHYSEQIDAGMVTRGKREGIRFPDSVRFYYDTPLLNQYERKSERCFLLRGIEVFDKSTNSWVEFIVECGYGIVMGYATPASAEFAPDRSKIRLNGFRKQYLDEDQVETMKEFLDASEIEVINPSEFYEVELEGKTYFHIAELDDGDFVGIDRDKNVYKITHDPFEISRLPGSIQQVLGESLLEN